MTNTPPKFENDLNSPSPPIKIRLYEKNGIRKVAGGETDLQFGGQYQLSAA